MPRAKKQTTAPVETVDYVYDENLSVRVKQRSDPDKENCTLDHYFGDLLRDEKTIDGHHKYCSLCLELHVIKR